MRFQGKNAISWSIPRLWFGNWSAINTVHKVMFSFGCGRWMDYKYAASKFEEFMKGLETEAAYSCHARRGQLKIEKEIENSWPLHRQAFPSGHHRLVSVERLVDSAESILLTEGCLKGAWEVNRMAPTVLSFPSLAPVYQETIHRWGARIEGKGTRIHPSIVFAIWWWRRRVDQQCTGLF